MSNDRGERSKGGIGRDTATKKQHWSASLSSILGGSSGPLVCFGVEGAYLTARVRVAHITRISHGVEREKSRVERGRWRGMERRKGAIRAELFWCDATADCHVRQGFPAEPSTCDDVNCRLGFAISLLIRREMTES